LKLYLGVILVIEANADRFLMTHAPLRVSVWPVCRRVAYSAGSTDLRAVSQDGHLIFGHFVDIPQPKFPQLFALGSAQGHGRLTTNARMALLVRFKFT
jgi:hypothetical protein